MNRMQNVRNSIVDISNMIGLRSLTEMIKVFYPPLIQSTSTNTSYQGTKYRAKYKNFVSGSQGGLVLFTYQSL